MTLKSVIVSLQEKSGKFFSDVDPLCEVSKITCATLLVCQLGYLISILDDVKE